MQLRRSKSEALKDFVFQEKSISIFATGKASDAVTGKLAMKLKAQTLLSDTFVFKENFNHPNDQAEVIFVAYR